MSSSDYIGFQPTKYKIIDPNGNILISSGFYFFNNPFTISKHLSMIDKFSSSDISFLFTV